MAYAANQIQQEEDENDRFFVAVHVGAGYHAPSNEKALRSAMKRACIAAVSILRKVSLFHLHTRVGKRKTWKHWSIAN